MSDLTYEATASLVQLVTAVRQLAAAAERQAELLEIIIEKLPATDIEGSLYVHVVDNP